MNALLYEGGRRDVWLAVPCRRVCRNGETFRRVGCCSGVVTALSVFQGEKWKRSEKGIVIFRRLIDAPCKHLDIQTVLHKHLFVHLPVQVKQIQIFVVQMRYDMASSGTDILAMLLVLYILIKWSEFWE